MPLFQCRHCGLRFRADTWDEVQALQARQCLVASLGVSCDLVGVVP